MTNIERSLREQLPQETDDILFSEMKLSDRMKANIRQQAASVQMRSHMRFRKAWIIGMSAVAAAAILIMGYPMMQQPTVPAPIQDPAGSVQPPIGGASGSQLSPLVTATLGSVEEAKAAFGDGLLVPNVMPEGYTLADIQTVSEGDVVRDVVITYATGDKAITFTASRNQAVFPADLFTKTEVNGFEGLVYEQPAFTELYWMESSIQYSIMGPITGEDAMKAAESAQL